MRAVVGYVCLRYVSVCSDIIMRIGIIIAVMVTIVSGRTPGTPKPTSSGTPKPSSSGTPRPHQIRTARRQRRNPLLKERDAIVRGFYVAHPTWTSPRVHAAVSPAIAAAGLNPMSYDNLSQQLTRLRRELNIPRTWGGIRPDHAAYLRDQFAQDRTQPFATVWRDFCTVWGPKAEKELRVSQWWYNTLNYYRRKNGELKKIGYQSVPARVQSTVKRVRDYDTIGVQSTQVVDLVEDEVQSARQDGLEGVQSTQIVDMLEDEVQSARQDERRRSDEDADDLPADWWNLSSDYDEPMAGGEGATVNSPLTGVVDALMSAQAGMLDESWSLGEEYDEYVTAESTTA